VNLFAGEQAITRLGDGELNVAGWGTYYKFDFPSGNGAWFDRRQASHSAIRWMKKRIGRSKAPLA